MKASFKSVVPTASCPANDFTLVLLQEGNPGRIDGHFPEGISLRRLLGNATGNDDHGAGYFNDAELEVHVGPPESAQLASLHSGEVASMSSGASRG